MAERATSPAFRILGPLRIMGSSEEPRGMRQRSLLAFLLLHAGEPVPTGRLVDAVWGEHPPPTATAIVHGYIRKLRAILAEAPAELLTQAPGYVLQVEAGELDAAVFERLAGEGREALRTGEPERARERLVEALRLWQGEPLGDLPAEGFVAEERRRLEQLRAEARADRVEADLALGRSGELVAELEAFVREQPFQEGPRRQLMLALYRAGRQADALQAYQDARRVLAGELGLEPSRELRLLQQAILCQDESLDARASVPVAQAESPGRHRSRRLRYAALGIAAFAVGGAVTAALAPGSARSRPLVRPAKILATIEMPNPSCCGIGTQAIWGVGHHNDVLYRIDPKTSRVVGHWKVAGFQSGVPEPQAGAVWIPSAAGELMRFDPISGHVVGRIESFSADVAYAYDYMWQTTRDHTLVRIDIRNNGFRQMTRYAAGANDWDDGLAFGAGAIWIGVGDTGRLLRIDPKTGHILHRIFLGNTYSELAPVFDDGAVWAFRFVGGQQILFRIDPATNKITNKIRVGPPNGSPPNGGIAAGDGYIWTCDWDGKISKIDERTKRVVARYTLPAGAEFVSYGDGSLWASAYDASEVYRIDPNS